VAQSNQWAVRTAWGGHRSTEDEDEDEDETAVDQSLDSCEGTGECEDEYENRAAMGVDRDRGVALPSVDSVGIRSGPERAMSAEALGGGEWRGELGEGSGADSQSVTSNDAGGRVISGGNRRVRSDVSAEASAMSSGEMHSLEK